MIQQIVVPFDGLKTTLPSVQYAISLAKLIKAKLHFLYVITNDSYLSVKKALGKGPLFAKRFCVERATKLFEPVKEILAKSNFRDVEFHVEFAQDVDIGVRDFVRREKIDLCIVQPSSYVHEVGDLAKLISKTIPCNALLVKSDFVLREGGKIMIPIDEKKEHLLCTDLGISIAKQSKSCLIFYHTTWRNRNISNGDPFHNCLPSAIENFKIAETSAQKSGISYKSIFEMAPTIEGGIIKCAVTQNVDFIIMTPSTSLIGGQADLVLRHSSYPLLLAK